MHGPGADGDRIDALYLRTLSRSPTADEKATWKRFLEEAGTGKAEGRRAPVSALPRKADPMGRLAKRLKSTARTAHEQAYEDLFWAMLNSSEMAFRH